MCQLVTALSGPFTAHGLNAFSEAVSRTSPKRAGEWENVSVRTLVVDLVASLFRFAEAARNSSYRTILRRVKIFLAGKIYLFESDWYLFVYIFRTCRKYFASLEHMVATTNHAPIRLHIKCNMEKFSRYRTGLKQILCSKTIIFGMHM